MNQETKGINNLNLNEMKKILVLLAFVSFGTFANASNLPVTRTLQKVNPLITANTSQVVRSAVTAEVKANKKCGLDGWEYSYTCGGILHTACCYASYDDALAAGNAAMACDATCPYSA